MPAKPAVFSIEELLTHADWLRRLATHVVQGDGDVDDVVQETWMAALRTPPQRDRPAQPWLAEVLRNFARRVARSERTRSRQQARTEQAGTLAPDPVATPETLIQRAEIQRLLVELVLALDEPFRSTLLLRYFEGQSAAQIARTQRLPAGTVRWRIKEGLARLRTALDARHGKDRARWCLLLTPLAGPRPPAAGFWKGVLIVSMQKKLVGAGALVLLLAALSATFIRRGPRTAVQGPDRPAAQPSAPPRPPVFLRALQPPAGEITPDDSPAGSIEGVVVSTLDGAGLPRAEVVFLAEGAAFSAIADANGRFHFAASGPGVHRLSRVAAEGHVAYAPDSGDGPITFTLQPGERIRGVRLALRPSRSCAGSVVDEAGKPVVGARMTAWMPRRSTSFPTVTPETDAEGRFTFSADGGAFIEARHGERAARAQVAFAALAACALRLQLGPARQVPEATITGRVESAAGRTVAGATVEASTNVVLHPQAHHVFARTVTDAAGRFRLSPLEENLPYEIGVSLADRDVAGADGVRGGTQDVVLRVASAGRLRGQVRDRSTGAPVVGFSVVLTSQSPPRAGTVHTRYDASGSFVIDGLPAGPYTAIVVADGHAPSAEQAVTIVPDPAPVPELSFQLAPGGRAHGQVIDRLTRAPIAGALVALEGRAGIGARVPLTAEVRTDELGRFTLRGLPAGRLSLLAQAAGHHGRVLGGLELQGEEELGPVAVDLAPTKTGETPRLELVGIGAHLARKPEPSGDVLVLGTLAPDGGAARAGLVTGDVVLAVDGHTIADGGLEGAVQRIRGAEGTVVVLRVRRAADGAVVDVPVVRRLVAAP